MMLIARMKSLLTGFARREDGTIAVEAMIVLPMMFWCFLSVFSIYDTFRTYSLSQKAAFTIGDAITRETAPIANDDMDGMKSLFDYLANARGDTAIRISSLWWDAEDDRFYADWSRTRGSREQLSNDDVETWASKLPVLPDNERITLVETWAEYDPPFKTGLEEQEIHNFVFTRPRFAPRVCWETCTGS